MRRKNRKRWPPGSAERRVELFYQPGVERYRNWHGGYLNFGLWEPGITRYVDAAQNMIRTLAVMAGIRSDSSVLDACCGMGPQCVFLHKTFGCTVHGIDCTWKHVVAGRTRIEAAGIEKHVAISHDTAVRLSFPDQTFTHVLNVEGGQHLHTRKRFFHEAYRVLQPGGGIAMADFVLTREPETRTERFILDAARRLWHIPLDNKETQESYGKTLESVGFRNVFVRCVGHLTIPGYFLEQRKSETLRAQRNIRGWLIAYAGGIIDYAVYKAYRHGLIEYVLARGEKPQP